MNRENIEYCIELMRNAKNLDMAFYQMGIVQNGLSRSIEDLHNCGNTACFAGYVAISPKFQADGGYVDVGGGPVLSYGSNFFESYYDEEAIEKWLDISCDLAYKLVYGDVQLGAQLGFSAFYDKWWKDVTADDVIKKLQMILDGELH